MRNKFCSLIAVGACAAVLSGCSFGMSHGITSQTSEYASPSPGAFTATGNSAGVSPTPDSETASSSSSVTSEVPGVPDAVNYGVYEGVAVIGTDKHVITVAVSDSGCQYTLENAASEIFESGCEIDPSGEFFTLTAIEADPDKPGMNQVGTRWEEGKLVLIDAALDNEFILAKKS